MQINVAQIGVGYWGPNLLRNFMSNKMCNVKTVVDVSQERLDYVKRLNPKISTAKDAKEVFNDSSIDAIVIATPVRTHYGLVMRALTSKKHVLVEKPMATNVTEIEHISLLAEEQSRVVMVGHTFLYNPAVRYLKKYVDSGELGDVRYIYSQRLNLGRIRSDVDALWNLAPHDISIIQYLLNDESPISVSRSGRDYIQEGVEDVVFMRITYAKKIAAYIHVSWLDPNKVRRTTVVGSKKMVIYDDMAENKIAIYDKGIDRMASLNENMNFDDTGATNFVHRSGDLIMPKLEWQEPLKAEVEHFVDCVVNNVECLTGMKHALEVVRILSS